MARVFLDANILFSAAWREGSGLVRMWQLGDVVLVSSAYALEEATRNLETDAQRARLRGLSGSLEVLSSQPGMQVPDGVDLPDKDVPILAAAIGAACDFLLTGDVRHFSKLLDQKVGGVTILLPSRFLERYPQTGK